MPQQIIDMDPNIYAQKKMRLLELGRMLEIPVLLGTLNIETSKAKDWEETPDGLLIPKHEPTILQRHGQPIGSWTRNMANILASQFCALDATSAASWGDTHLSLKNESGTVRGNTGYPIGAGSATPMYAVLGDDTQGIAIGTGAGATSFEDYALTKIAHGSAGGEMWYFDFKEILQTWNSGPRTWDIEMVRFFRNYSGGSITINEIGLIGRYDYAVSTFDDFLVARDKLTSGVAVADDEVFSARYKYTTAAWPS